MIPTVKRRRGEKLSDFESRRLKTQIEATTRLQRNTREQVRALEKETQRYALRKERRADPEACRSISITADGVEAIIELRDQLEDLERAREMLGERIEEAVETMHKDPAVKWARAAERAQVENFGRTVDTCAENVERCARALSQHLMGVLE